MMAVTHASFAIVLLYLLGEVSRDAALIAAAGALLPDIDTPRSATGRVFPFISIPIYKKFGHRSITHTVYAFAAALLISLAIGKIELALGYASHLLSDMATKTGVPLLYPKNKYFVFPGNAKARVETGSGRELVLFSFLFLIASSTAFVPSPKVILYNMMGTENAIAFQVAGFLEKNKTVEATVKYFEGSEVVTKKFIVVGVEKEGIVLFDPERKEFKKTKDLRIIKINAEETEKYRVVSEELEPWDVFRRDYDVFIITVRFEHQIEGKREYKTRREIEDLSDVLFEGKATGIKVENVYIG